MRAKIFWEPEERGAVVDCIVQKIRSGKARVNMEGKRIYGLKTLVVDAQEEVLAAHRRRPPTSVLVSEITSLLRASLDAVPAPSPVDLPEPEQPSIPSRLGLNPKFAEAVAYVAQELVRAFSEKFGEAVGKEIGKNVRDAIYDVRHHMGTPRDYVGRDPQPSAPPPAQDFGDLPARLQTPKVLVLGLLPQQQQTISRTFPNLNFRFMGKGTPSKHIGQVAQGCVRVFSMVKFIRHNDEAQVPSDKLRRVNGGMTDLTISIQRQFPETPYVPARTGVAV